MMFYGFDFLAFLGFALVMSITPGPNVLMLLNSGASFGVVATQRHIVGIYVGLITMLFLVGFGLGELFVQFPQIKVVLKTLSLIFLIYICWRILQVRSFEDASARGRPFSVFEGAGFQYVNTKAWAMLISAFSLYLPDDGDRLISLVFMALGFTLVIYPACMTWVIAGQQMRSFLKVGQRFRWFNVIMVGLLVISVVPALFAQS